MRCRRRRPSRCADSFGAAAEDVAAGRVDAVENSMPAGEHARNLEPQPPRQRAGQRTSRLEQRARARRFERHQRAPRAVAARLGDLRFGDAEAVEVLGGKIDSRPWRQSAAMSCQKLISCSAVQIASLAARFAGVVGIEDAKHQPADRIGGAPAVVEELRFGSHSASSSRPGGTPRAGRGTAAIGSRCRAIAAASSGNGGAAGGVPASMASSAASKPSSAARRSAGAASPSSAKSSAIRAKR